MTISFFIETTGYYADVNTGCRVFHICSEDGNKLSFPCGNGTLFSQINKVCQWSDDVDCQRSGMFFPGSLNPAVRPTASPQFNPTQIPRPSRRQVSATTPPMFHMPGDEQQIKFKRPLHPDPEGSINGPKPNLFTPANQRPPLRPTSST